MRVLVRVRVLYECAGRGGGGGSCDHVCSYVCGGGGGISLLEVVAKMAGRLIQNRLQSRAEHLLPESQCGFRPNRGCADAVFTVRQLVEKAYEHRTKIFCIFVDLRKAYDSVPRAALYRALSLLGIPPTLLNVIESFHDGRVAEVRVPGGVTDEIRVENDLRQGCVMAPILFKPLSGAGG